MARIASSSHKISVEDLYSSKPKLCPEGDTLPITQASLLLRHFD